MKDDALQPRDLRRLLRLVERRPLPSRAEPGPSLPECGRRLRAPQRFLQPRRGARADAAHRGQHGRADGACTRRGTCWPSTASCSSPSAACRTRTRRSMPAARASIDAARPASTACAPSGVRFVNVTPTARRPRHRRRRRVDADPAQHRRRADAGARATRCYVEKLHDRDFLDRCTRRLRQVRAYVWATDGTRRRRNGPRRSPAFRAQPHRRAGARDGGDPHARSTSAGRCSARITASSRSGRWSRWPACWARSACRAAASASATARSTSMGSAQPDVLRPDAAAGHQPGARLHPGRAHHRHAAQSRRHDSPTTARTLTYPDIQLVYWAGGNPFHHHQDLNRLLMRVAQARDHHRSTSSSGRRPRKHGRHRAAGDDHAGARRHRLRQRASRFLIAMKKAREPVGEARDDY